MEAQDFAVGPAEPAVASQSARVGELADLVDRYVLPSDWPEAEWLVPLNLEQPRRDLHCLSPFTRASKRAVDIVLALILLIGLAPVMALVALLVRLTSPGPVVYRQVRTGLNLRRHRDRRSANPGTPPPGIPERRKGGDRRKAAGYGRPFVMYKLRTMHADAEREGARWAVRGDPRVTPVGRFLRRTRLDEVPQLWNVLRGEMSMVGPRPERPEFIERLSREVPGYLNRLGLKPGLTGLSQVINGYDDDLESVHRKAALDLLYLQNCCLRNDLKILLRTVGVVVTGRGAW